MARRGEGWRQRNLLDFDLYSGENAKMECNSAIQSLGDSRVPGASCLCVRMGFGIQAFPL